MARGVRQHCPPSGFLFAMAFRPILQMAPRSYYPKDPDNLEFLQPAQCAHADDIAVTSFSFRSLTSVLAPAFRSVDSIAGLDLNYRRCCWVQYGTEGRESLWHWFSENCGSFVRCRLRSLLSTWAP